MAAGVEGIAELPVDMIREILCFLPTKEAARMSTVSKSWFEAWRTCRVLNFDVNDGFFNPRKSHQTNLEKFSHAVKSNLERLRSRKMEIEGFILKPNLWCFQSDPTLISEWIETALANGIKKLVLNFKFGPQYTLPRTILETQSLTELELSTGDDSHWLEMPPVTADIVTCYGLRRLHLDRVRFGDGSMLEKIIAGCGSLECLSLIYCWGLKRVKIASGSLKKLELKLNWPGDELHIDAPSIAWFKYAGFIVPRVSSIRPLSVPHLSEIFVSDGKGGVDTSWFVRLSEFLMKLIRSKFFLQLDFDINSNFDFNSVHAEELAKRSNRSSEVPQVDRLSTVIRGRSNISDGASAFLDAIFWTCRPKVLALKLPGSCNSTQIAFAVGEHQ